MLIDLETRVRYAFMTTITWLVALALASAAADEGPEYLKAHFTKREVQIPMRDGARLFTAIYEPKDRAEKYPFLMIRTQSGVLPYGEDQFPKHLGPSPLFSKEPYIYVYQDIRGRWMSDGTYVNLRPHNPNKQGTHDVDESTDTYDTIEWLLKNVENNSGKVGHYGTSYRGWLVAAGMLDAHRALVAAAPQAPIIDWFAADDWHHNGALLLAHTFFYMPRQGRLRPAPFNNPPPQPDYGTPDGYDFFLRLGPLANIDARYYKGEVPFWHEFARHATRDEFWKARNLGPHLKNIKPAVLLVGGWFDAENLYGILETYRRIESQSLGTNSVLVMGPWIHGGWNSNQGDGSSLGPVGFDLPTADFYRAQIEKPFFEYHLKGKGNYSPPETRMFETGVNRWREFKKWPPQRTKPLAFYLRELGRLSTAAPNTSTATEFDEFVSDPARPVPYTDKISFRLLPEFMCGDQRFAATRPDVLVYEAAPLEQDVTIAGPIDVELVVSTTGTDSDWIVKLIDVYPDNLSDPNPNPTGVRLGGYQQLVRGEVMRGKFRDSLETLKPFEPGQPTPVKFKLLDVLHTFRRGHKIMVQVQCSWFPLIDRNPQKFVDIYRAQEGDFQKATQRVYRSPGRASRIVMEQLP